MQKGGGGCEHSTISGGRGNHHLGTTMASMVLQVSHDDHGGTSVSFIEALDVRRPDKVVLVVHRAMLRLHAAPDLSEYTMSRTA
jgi:hypothetical protein